MIWHKVAADLAKSFTVIATDLRGYGASECPPSDPEHYNYSKRAMAADQIAVMEQLGFSSFFLCGHDRGGRVSHRMALDFPESVKKLIVLDIAPTREMYRNTTDGFARDYWHWFFLIQRAPLPETMIGADPDVFWRKKSGDGKAGLTPFTEGALNHYLNAFRNPDVIRANCEDYRAAATIDLLHDDEDGDKKVPQPFLVLWGQDGVIESRFDALELWRMRAENVTGHAVSGGHYVPEENPKAVVDACRGFFLNSV